jgi:hypothetical protein
MTVKISIYDHVFKNAEPEIVEYSSVAEWLLDNKKRLVNFAVFNGQSSHETDITKDVNALMSDSGEYIILISPASALDVLFPFWSVSVRFIDYLAKQLIPDIPVSNLNRTQQSPNNALAGRTNEPRVLQRIEDIYGQVRSYPSLLQPVYSKYINNTQYEYSYMCIGRGWYDIDDVKDGETLLSDITGTKAEFYNPFTSPNSGSPFLTIGGAIGENINLVKKSNNVDGEVLQARNQFTLTQSSSIEFKTAADAGSTGDRLIVVTPVSEFFDELSSGVGLDITGAGIYDGSYIIASVLGADTIELTTATFVSTSTTTGTLINTTAEPEWSDWVTLKDADMWQFWVNIIAQQGLYAQDGDGRYNLTVSYEIQYQRVVSGTPTGSVYTYSGSLTSNKPDQVAKTIEITTGWLGATRVRVRRSSNHDFGFSGNVIDEVKYESLSAVTPITLTDFGNVTTVQVVTKATQRALSLKERKFNALVTRKLPTYNGTSWSGVLDSDGSILSGTIAATTSFVNILAAITIDSYVGRQSITAIDLAQIYARYSEIGSYFSIGTEPMSFHYTLDNDNVSYEETVRLIANAVFCIAYRQNGKIRFTFDKPQTSSTALFTHRNKKPSSDVISRRFTADAEYDGIELTYNDNVTDAQEVIKLPLSGLATNYKKIELAGVREYAMAYLRAAREYNKLKYQRISIETETTTDGRLLLPNQRIDIVDNTRFDSQDGEVIAQSGLTLTLSRNLVFGVGTHSILLMKRDGSLESIGCTAGTNANQVVLDYAPSEAINTTHGGANGVRTIFSFGADSVASANSYLVQEVNISDKSYVKVSAINYDANYYNDDLLTVPNREDVL